MALPTLGYSERLPSLATGVPNVFAVNSAHIVKGTLNVNEVVDLANTAFHDVLAPSIRDASPSLASSLPDTKVDVEAAGELVARS
jgi:hypothetical protein